jgi:DNA-binding IclR family transcriptional regulator
MLDAATNDDALALILRTLARAREPVKIADIAEAMGEPEEVANGLILELINRGVKIRVDRSNGLALAWLDDGMSGGKG